MNMFTVYVVTLDGLDIWAYATLEEATNWLVQYTGDKLPYIECRHFTSEIDNLFEFVEDLNANGDWTPDY